MRKEMEALAILLEKVSYAAHVCCIQGDLSSRWYREIEEVTPFISILKYIHGDKKEFLKIVANAEKEIKEVDNHIDELNTSTCGVCGKKTDAHFIHCCINNKFAAKRKNNSQYMSVCESCCIPDKCNVPSGTEVGIECYNKEHYIKKKEEGNWGLEYYKREDIYYKRR